MRFSPTFNCFTSMIGWNFLNERYKIQTMQILFSQPPLLIFIKGANISGGHSISDFFSIMLICCTINYFINVSVENNCVV